MQSSNMKEKRAYPRKVFYSEVIATCSLGKIRRLLCINYSNSGIALISFAPINIGEVFKLKLTLTDNNDSLKHQLSAEVVQSHNTSEIYVLGLRFEEELEQDSRNQAS